MDFFFELGCYYLNFSAAIISCAFVLLGFSVGVNILCAPFSAIFSGKSGRKQNRKVWVVMKAPKTPVFTGRLLGDKFARDVKKLLYFLTPFYFIAFADSLLFACNVICACVVIIVQAWIVVASILWIMCCLLIIIRLKISLI